MLENLEPQILWQIRELLVELWNAWSYPSDFVELIENSFIDTVVAEFSNFLAEFIVWMFWPLEVLHFSTSAALLSLWDSKNTYPLSLRVSYSRSLASWLLLKSCFEHILYRYLLRYAFEFSSTQITGEIHFSSPHLLIVRVGVGLSWVVGCYCHETWIRKSVDSIKRREVLFLQRKLEY
jgi:hypothetical protein